MRAGAKRRGTDNQHVHMRSVESSDSDEDYVLEAEDIDDQSDDLNFLVGDASEEESCYEAEEEEEEEEDVGGWRRVIKTRARKGTARGRRNGIKNPIKRRRVRTNDDEDSDDDDDDFTPEADYSEEEEELEEEDEEEEEEYCLVERKTRKRGRTTLKKKSGSVKSQRKRSVKAGRKPCTKRYKKPRNLRRAKSCDDEDFVEEGPTLRGRSKKKRPLRRKKQGTVCSESDFCSESSDYEFTISEEELEQIREANMICGSAATNLRSSRRIQEQESLYEPIKPPARKGKEKADVIKKDVGKPVCGICLTEEGKNTVRGTLDCCSHYFCFACIFEWSKVESRCPLCKQRFAAISKPARFGKGFDLRDTVVTVPERDQVYQPSEEELRDFLNPYENVICTECHQGGDDALMLLCDLCDSPAHTYCVGLGREVPVGNWYCDGCRPTAFGSSHSQTPDFTPDQRSSTGASDGTSVYENMAEIDLNVTIPETPVSQGNGFLSSPRFVGGSLEAPSPVSGVGVSTVSGRRMIHRQIRHILSNRLSQISPGADVSVVGNLIGRGVNISTEQQNRTTDVGPSHYAQYVDRLQENPSISVQNRNSFPGRMGHMVRQINQPSTSANGFVHSQIQWSGLDRSNMDEGQSQSPMLAGEQPLRPCTSRPMGPEIDMSSHNRYEEHVNFVKQVVHSMVRSQLKSLSRDMNIGHDDYVEISRKSAHAIMAAYGLEPRRHDMYEAPPPSCHHFESRLANVEPSPMNGCCLACFKDFVKDVVKMVMDIILQPHRSGFRH